MILFLRGGEMPSEPEVKGNSNWKIMKIMVSNNITRWWFLQLKDFFFIFTPKLGEDEPILTIFYIFQMGWFNHQLDITFKFQPLVFHLRICDWTA